MSTNVGQIDMDLVVNSSNFRNQVRSAVNGATGDISNGTGKISSKLGKIGKIIATAFAVKQVVSLGKACVNLGSDLIEVQNVVDVTFTSMAGKVNEFAKNAITSAGLSETVAKKYTGTFGAMAKSFGFSEDEAYNMSTALTQLSGDVASFYNITTDEAYTKLKSVFTGETESLKELGVVMTQNALDAYALANGYGKTTSNMSEAEKVSLRFAFVQSKLATAQGDFARTSDSWANQVRVLKLRFDALRASIGKGLIAVFTPVIKMLNLLLSKLQVVADAFAKFTDILKGKKGSSGKTSTPTEKVSDDVKSVGDNAVKATKSAKELKRTLAGFDEINTLQKQDSDSDSAGSGSGTANTGASAGGVSLANSDVGGEADKLSEKIMKLLEKVKKFAKECAEQFKIGFNLSFVKSDFDALKENIKRLGKNLKDIFTDKDVVASAKNFVLTFSKALGQVVGACAEIGVSIGNALIGGLNNYLEGSKEFIKQSIVNLFDIGSELVALFGNFATAVATVFSSIGSESGQKLVGGIMSVFGNMALGMATTFGRTLAGVLQVVFQPLIDNAGKIKQTFENIFDILSPIFIGMGKGIAGFYDGLDKLYKNVLKPIINAVTKFLSGTLGVLLDWLNDVLEPLGGLSESLSGVWEIIGYLIGGITTVLAVVAGFKTAVFGITTIITGIQTAIGALGTAFTFLCSPIGITVVIIGTLIAIGILLYQNWDTIKKKAQELADGIVEYFQGIPEFWGGVWDAVKNKAVQIWTGIKESASNLWKNIRDGIKNKVQETRDGVVNKFNELKNGTKSKFEETLGSAKTTWGNIKTAIKDKTREAKDSAVSSFTTLRENAINKTRDIGDKIKKGFSSGVDFIKNLKDKAYTWMTDFVDGLVKGIQNGYRSIADAVTGIAETIKSYLHFSVPDVGPLTDYESWMPDFMQGLANGISANKNLVTSAIQGLTSDMAVNPQVMYPALATAGAGGMAQGSSQGAEQGGVDTMLATMSTVLTKLNKFLDSQASESGDSTPDVAVYIGEQQLDSIIVSAQNRRNLRSGGKA